MPRNPHRKPKFIKSVLMHDLNPSMLAVASRFGTANPQARPIVANVWDDRVESGYAPPGMPMGTLRAQKMFEDWKARTTPTTTKE